MAVAKRTCLFASSGAVCEICLVETVARRRRQGVVNVLQRSYGFRVLHYILGPIPVNVAVWFRRRTLFSYMSCGTRPFTLPTRKAAQSWLTSWLFP